MDQIKCKYYLKVRVYSTELELDYCTYLGEDRKKLILASQCQNCPHYNEKSVMRYISFDKKQEKKVQEKKVDSFLKFAWED